MDKLTIAFPNGGYGHYLGSVIMSSLFDYKGFSPTKTGSLHSLWQNYPTNLRFTHIKQFVQTEQVIIIDPHRDHCMDYTSNNFLKRWNVYDNALTKWVRKAWHPDFFDKIRSIYNVTDRDEDIAPWMIRESVSLWVGAEMESTMSYYTDIKGLHVSSVDVIENIDRVIRDVANYLNVQYNEPDLLAHREYVSRQISHGVQKRCTQWASDIINGIESENPCTTLMDEAYVQHLLRTQGYEIKCDGLNSFPKTSLELKELIYEASSHSN